MSPSYCLNNDSMSALFNLFIETVFCLKYAMSLSLLMNNMFLHRKMMCNVVTIIQCIIKFSIVENWTTQ